VTDPEALATARALLEADLAELDLACSRFRPDSELTRVNEQAASASEPVTTAVSALLADAIAVSLKGAEFTDGDVDPTVGSALIALGYDRDFDEIQDSPRAVSVVTVSGWQSVRLDVGARELTLPPGTQLDLGATAKGWAADRCADRIHQSTGTGVLVSLGGDTAVAGEPPQAEGWRIRVQDVTGMPDEDAAGPTQVVAIKAGGLATSSTTARRWHHGGDVLHHILDPRTGLPAEPVWRTVSVSAKTCASANIASTAAIIKGRKAARWLNENGFPARLVAIDGTVTVVGGWPGA
jgi:thiamine biosynthesis lipoprotein ApbE